MTETEKKALALWDAVCAEWEVSPATEDDMDGSACFAALTRAIEQHEAFRQEVSKAITDLTYAQHQYTFARGEILGHLEKFVLKEPADPLVQVLDTLGWSFDDTGPDMEEDLRAALAARGLEVRKIGEGE